MHEEIVFGGAVAQGGERGRSVVDAPAPPEHVDCVQRSSADSLRDAEQLVFSVPEHAVRIDLGRDADITRAWPPPPGRIDLANREPVVGEHRE
jgi:hypothetical protein